jgi:eukaryotic-like serine/threonine-protein kinase
VKVIAPRAQTPAPSRSSGIRTSGRIPEELLRDQVRRLAASSVVIAGCWTFGLVTDALVVPWLLDAPRNDIALANEAFGIVLSTVMFAYLRSSDQGSDTKTTMGLVFMVANALGIAIMNASALSSAMGSTMPNLPMVSWTAVLILLFATISPTSPRRMFIAGFTAATMDPLVAWIRYLLDLPTMPPHLALLHYVPNYIAAAISMVPFKVMHGLGKRLKEAQDLGSYHLVERLGQGGMGEVWRAEHRLLARSAAVKLVRPELLGGGGPEDAQTIRRRFEREAQATAALASPHTIRVFDYGMTDEGAFYYVMELLSGRDLESFVREFGPVSPDRAIYLLRQVCHSLAEAHARGLVHRDIKPANIYVCRMGLEYDFVKVLDFGLVKVRQKGATPLTATLDHHTSGTPAYMAPEIILGEANVDRRADVYALGCVAYYLLTGHLVFEADTPMKMLMQHVHARPVPPSQRTELRIPRELDELVLSCLEKDPMNRPQNAEELFRMAVGCKTCETWSQASARNWWQTHLSDLTGPLTLTESDTPTTTRVVAAL